MSAPVYVVATIRPWNIEATERFMDENPQWDIHLITEKSDLQVTLLQHLQPRYIFFPHWSWLIPKEIYSRWECVVFHMTDLPFGRGGSPLQNLLTRGIYQTKITALRVTGWIDEGPVYLKRDLDISKGSAGEIYQRASRIVFEEMIPYIIENCPEPIPQEGKGVCFPRRTPAQSKVPPDVTHRKLYDHIRMLDAEEYPPAFIEYGNFRMEFSNAKMEEGKVLARVQVTAKESPHD